MFLKTVSPAAFLAATLCLISVCLLSVPYALAMDDPATKQNRSETEQADEGGDPPNSVAEVPPFPTRKSQLAKGEISADDLLALLDSQDSHARMIAALQLRFRPEIAGQSIPLLVRAMRDPADEVRAAAIHALEILRPHVSAALPELLDMLEEDDSLIQRGVMAIIRDVGPAAAPAMPALIKLLSAENFHTQYWACRSIGKVGAPDALPAVPKLIELLENGVTSVRGNAAEALGRIGPAAGERVVAPLTAATSAGSLRVREGALTGLVALGPFAKSAEDVLKTAMNNSKYTPRAKAALAYWRVTGDAEAAVGPMVAVIADRDTPWEGAEAIAELGAEAKSAVPGLTSLLADEKYETRMYAAAALGAIGPAAKDALPALQELATDGQQQDDVRTTAAAAVQLISMPPVTADVLLRGGMLYLGDGQLPVTGDVAIIGERIAAVGQFPIEAVRHEIDCNGLIVCPGFIDLHNHSDRQVLQKSTRAVVNFLTQGCTTIVTGNCGSGPVDVGRYYDEIDNGGVGVNVAHLLPQGSLRRQVIGTTNRKATAAELEQMSSLVEEAMRDGAWGMSTGLIYVPSSYADTDELIRMATIVGEHGGIYASHIRNENVRLLEAVEEALTIGREANLPVHISHYKSSGKDSWGLVRVATEIIEKRRASGQPVTADQYPYTASSTSLDATLIPAWARSGGQKEMLQRLDDKEQGPRIKAAIEAKLTELDGGRRLQIASFSKQPSWSGRRLSEIAAAEGVDPIDLAMRIVRQGGAAIVNHSINEQDVRFVMQLPWVATASDGRSHLPNHTVPHPRNYGTFPRKIGYYSIAEGVVPLEQAIRSATGLPADILGMKDRGYLRAGSAADVVVFDAEKLQDNATFKNPHRYSTGIEHVLVNGQLAIADGHPTGALAGKALRRADSENSADENTAK